MLSKYTLFITALNHSYRLAMEGEGKISLGLNLPPCNEVNLEESRANSWGAWLSSGMSNGIQPGLSRR